MHRRRPLRAARPGTSADTTDDRRRASAIPSFEDPRTLDRPHAAGASAAPFERCELAIDSRAARAYLGRHGSWRVAKAALLGAIPPFLLKRDDNPEGVDGQVFEGIKAAIVKDRFAYLKAFLDDFYNVDVLAPDRILPIAATAGRLSRQAPRPRCSRPASASAPPGY